MHAVAPTNSWQSFLDCLGPREWPDVWRLEGSTRPSRGPITAFRASPTMCRQRLSQKALPRSSSRTSHSDCAGPTGRLQAPGGGKSAPSAKPKRLGRDGRPLAYCCYLCGAQFGSQSLRIHIAKCQEKWENKESGKPPRERRAVPPPPPELDANELPTSAEGIEGAHMARRAPCSLCAQP